MEQFHNWGVAEEDGVLLDERVVQAVQTADAIISRLIIHSAGVGRILASGLAVAVRDEGEEEEGEEIES